ncbi:hypothetical protein ACIGXF_38860 [Streptomyces sp. NPDC053086]|uniref:hypothetical protein n=1 Tax=unclassified Streptomyces TaxID=2593676 RepID=UPI0037D593B3
MRRQRPEAKILMAARPYGLPAVRDALRGLGVDPRTVPTRSLAELSTTDATTLAAEALGPGKQQAARWPGPAGRGHFGGPLCPDQAALAMKW